MNTITGKTNAYVTAYSSIRPEDFKRPTDDLISRLYYANDDAVPEGWTLAGEAHITVKLVDQDTLISNKVESLRAELQQHRADSHVVQQRLEAQIGKLLAISYEPQS